MILPHKINLTTEKINDKAFNKIGALIFSAFVLLGLIDGVVSKNLSFYKIILLILSVIGLTMISFNFIAGKTLKVIISFGLILLLIFHSISLLVTAPAIDNFGKLYLILSIFFLGLLYLSIMFTHKILSFELINKTESDGVLFSKSIKQLRKFFFVLFLFFLSISINWFIVNVKYHTVFITFLSLVSLFTYIYLKTGKSENNIKITKTIITTLPLISISFTWDYISWRWFVFNKLSNIDKSLGLIDPQRFTLVQSILINIGFNLINIILIILLAKTIINYLGYFKLRKRLYDTLKAKKQDIVLDPKEYNFLWYFYILFLFPLIFFIRGYIFILTFIIVGYYFLTKNKIISFKYRGKKLKENMINNYLKEHSSIVWKIIIPLLILTYILSALISIPFLIKLISGSLS